MIRRKPMPVTALLVANLVALIWLPVLFGAQFHKTMFIVIGNVALLVPTLACFGYAFRRRARRGPAVWLGLALLSQAAGNVIYSAWTQYQAHPPVPAPSDIAYFGFYVSVTAAVVWLARREHGSFPRALWLDGAIGAAGAATALAAGLSFLDSGAQGVLRCRARRRGLHGRGSGPRRDDRRTAHDPRSPRRLDLGVARRGNGDLLRGRRDVRDSGGRGNLLRERLADSRVDDGSHLHRSGDLVAAAACRDQHCTFEDAAGDSDAGDDCSTRDSRDLLVSRAPGRDVAGDVHTAARHGQDVRELPAGAAPLRCPSPGRHRRAHGPREQTLALRPW